jgi:hypothetical protein
MRPPTRTATLATASRVSSRLPMSRTCCSFRSRSAAIWSRICCHDCRLGASVLTATGDRPEGRYVLTNADASAGSSSFRFKT